MENLIEAPPEVRARTEKGPCGIAPCDGTAAIELRGTPLCLEHFVPVCTQEIEARGDRLKNGYYDEAATQAFKNFIASCAEHASRFLQDSEGAGEFTKGRLEEFLRRVSHMGQRLRRSPRMTSSVPIYLRREDSGRTWEEETWTITVSQHGASLVCRHPVETGGSLVVSRRDRANRVQARVVYCRYNAEGWREIGVELLDRDDFWGLAPAPRMQPA
ncbi:MAG TPA: PilZ domain-containing protein [Candidatus Acidoferrum sp.]|nr:PilZ domain-containing protein [Candidatus Acidoferrum sp.]